MRTPRSENSYVISRRNLFLNLQVVLFMQVETHRGEGTVVTTVNSRPTASVSQRRSQRIVLAVPLTVTGTRSNGANFSEETRTQVVNANGGLVSLREPVLVGQILRLSNLVTKEEIVCTVVDINSGNDGEPEIGVEFAEACPRFWRVSFPPADWTPRSPEAKRSQQGPGRSTTSPASPKAPLPVKK